MTTSKNRWLILSTALIAAFALAIYLWTLHPGVGPSLDSIELQMAVLTRGIIHPPGSPQYIMLGSLAMRVLPGANAAARLNLMSALTGSAMIAVTYLLAHRLTESIPASAFAALTLAIAPRIWYQSSITELYTLNGLYVALTLYLLLTWHQTHHRTLFWAATVVYALSFGNHTSMILLLPAYLLAIWFTDRSILRPHTLLIVAAIIILAALQYVYIPLRAAEQPPLCNFCPAPGDLFDYLTGGGFKRQFFGVPRRLMITRLSESIGLFNRQFLPWGYALGVIGLWELARRHFRVAMLFALALLAEYAFVIGYDIPDWHDFLTPAYVIFTPLVAYGALRLWQIIVAAIEDEPIHRRLSHTRLINVSGIVLAVVAVGALIVTVLVHYPQVNQRDLTAMMENGEALVAYADSDARLLVPLTSSAAYYYGGWAIPYLAQVEGKTLTAIMPPEIDPPPGPAPYYARWSDAESTFTAASTQLLIIDPADPRIEGSSLLPICVPHTDIIAGYEVVAAPDPLVPPDRWLQIEPYIFTPGETASCPPR